jgi:stage V sporulation protein B
MPHKTHSRLTGAVYLVAAQAVVLVFGYATHLLIGRTLGPAPYGTYGVVLSVQSIFGLILTLGVPVAISRAVAQDQEHARSILRQGLRVQTVLALVVGGIALATSPLLGRALRDTTLTPYLMFSALVIFSQAFYPVYTQFLSGVHFFKRQALLTAFYATVKLIAAVALVFVIQLFGAFAGFMAGGIAAGIAGLWYTRGIGGEKTRVISVKSLLSFAGTYVLILVGLQILMSLDLFMVKALLHDDVQAGYYNAAVTLSRISYMLLQAVGFVLLPSVAALTTPGKSHEKAAQFIADTIRYLIAIIVPGVVLAATTSKSLITLFYSEAYTPAAPALTVLMVGLGALSFYLLLSNIVAGAGRARVSLTITLGLLILSGALGWWLINAYGMLGAAWQTTITALVGLLILAAYTFKSFAIPVPWLSTLNVIIASAVASLPTLYWHTTPLSLIPHYVLFALLYLTSLVVLREVRADDRRRLAGMHPRFSWLAPKR